MARLNPKSPRAPPPSSAAYIASTVDTYMANMEPAAAARSKQKIKLKKSPAALAAGGSAPSRKGNFCRNPFCGATLSSAFAKFCDQKPHCQLYRGLLLHCGSFASEREQAVDDALEKLQETKRRKLRRSASASDSAAAAAVAAADFSIPKRKVPSPAAKSAAASPVVSAEAMTEGDKLRRRYERTQQVTTAVSSESSGKKASSTTPAAAPPVNLSNAPEASKGKKRRLGVAVGSSESSAASASVGTSLQGKSVQPASVVPSRPPTPVNKVGGIEVIPLGAGRHSSSFGGGSRYVQSGNRSAVGEDLRPNNPLIRPSSVSKLPTPTEPVASALPPRLGSVDPRPQQKAPAWTDPGRNQPATRNEVIPSSSSQDAQALSGAPARDATQYAKRAISATEYLNSRKPQDPRLRPPLPQSNGNLHGSAKASSSGTLRRSSSELSDDLASSFPNGASREKTLSRSMSDMSAQRHRDKVFSRDSDPGFPKSVGDLSSSSGSRPSPYKDLAYARPSSYDAPSSYSHREYDFRVDPFPPDRPPTSRPYTSERQQEYSYEPDYHRPSSSYSQDRPEWPRRSEEPLRPQYRDPAPFPAAASRANSDHPTSQQQQQQQSQTQAAHSQQHDANLLPEISPVMFSSHDPFMVNLLSRFASFYPKALAPVLNKTKKPRKMRFYLDYVERVKELSGSRFDVRIADKKGVVSLAGREWLSLKGTSTVDLHVQILKTLLEQGIAWRKLVEDSHRVYGNGVKRLGDRADRSKAFIRMWQGMKYNSWDKFPTERQVTYFRGDTRHHWTFCVGNVELGSGSHEEKREAFRLAAENSMRFLLSLEILNDNQKYANERERDREQADWRGSRESDQHQAAGSNDRASRDSNGARTSSRTEAPRQPTSAGIEVIDTPETTLSRLRDGSFGSDAEGAFSPGDHGASDDDMDISEEDDAVSRGSRELTPRYSHRAPSSSFDALDLLQNGLPTQR